MVQRSLFPPNDDFLTDRLCHRYGVLLFVAVAMVIAWSVANQDAFRCRSSVHLHAEDTNGHDTLRLKCWAVGRFFTVTRHHDDGVSSSDVDVTMPTTRTHRSAFELSRVRYLPLLLVLQTLLFLVPRYVWTFGCQLCGYSVQHAVKAIDETMRGQSDGDYSCQARYLFSYLKAPCSSIPWCWFEVPNIILTLCYLLCKLLYIVFCIIQMVILQAYLGFNFFAYGFKGRFWESPFQQYGFEGVHLEEHAFFPRIAHCELKDVVNGTRSVAVECVLGFNETVELGLFVVWLWLGLSIITLFSALVTRAALALFYGCCAKEDYRKERALKMIRASARFSDRKTYQQVEFSDTLLNCDGALIFDILEASLSMNASSALATATWLYWLYEMERSGFQTGDDVSDGENDTAGISRDAQESMPLHPRHTP